MASLATHFTASLFLFPIGVRRLISSIYHYLKNPSHFGSKAWYFSEPKWKNIDLYTLLISLPVSSLSLVFIFLALSGNTNPSPTYRFSFLQQSFVVFLLWALVIMIVFKESLDLYSVPESFVFVCAGTVFIIESYMCGRDMVGLSGVVYELLSGLAMICGSCCVFLAIRPSAFFADFTLSCALVLKGSWVMQVGFSLYTDVLGLKGCEKISDLGLSNSGEVDIKCELEDDKWRAIALMNMLFLVHVTVVVVIGFVLFGFLNRYKNTRYGDGIRHPMADLGSEGMLMQPLPEIEIE